MITEATDLLVDLSNEDDSFLELRKAVSNVPRHEKTGFLPLRKQRRRSTKAG